MTYCVYLKSWFLFLRFFFSSKNPFTFLGCGGGSRGGGVYIFDILKGEGFNEFIWNPTGGGGRVKKTQFWRGRLKCMAPYQLISIPNFLFIPKCALDKIAESTRSKACKSSSFTSHFLRLIFGASEDFVKVS